MNYFDTPFNDFDGFHHEQHMTHCDERRNCKISGGSYLAEFETPPTQSFVEIPSSQVIFDDQKDEDLFLECMMSKFAEANETSMDPFELLLQDIGYPSSESVDLTPSSMTTNSSTHMNTNEFVNQHYFHTNAAGINQENQNQLYAGNANNFQSYSSFSPAIDQRYEMMDHAPQTSPSMEYTFQTQSQPTVDYINVESTTSSRNASPMGYAGGVFQFWDNTSLDSEMVINLSKHNSSFPSSGIDRLSSEPTLQDLVQEAIHDYKTRQKQNALIEVDHHRQNLSFQERYEFALQQERNAFKSVSSLAGTNLEKAALDAMRQFWISKNR